MKEENCLRDESDRQFTQESSKVNPTAKYFLNEYFMTRDLGGVMSRWNQVTKNPTGSGQRQTLSGNGV